MFVIPNGFRFVVGVELLDVGIVKVKRKQENDDRDERGLVG